MGGIFKASVSQKPISSASTQTTKPWLGISREGWKAIGSGISDATGIFADTIQANAARKAAAIQSAADIMSRATPDYSALASIDYDVPDLSSRPIVNFDANRGSGYGLAGISQGSIPLRMAAPTRNPFGAMPAGSGFGTM